MKNQPPRPSEVAAPDLETYRRKRLAGSTPEPFGDSQQMPSGRGPGLFVVQKHAARNLHYDLRLQVGGVLKSWAVPKGPSLDPAEKRFAVVTEDHPLEYADFEGVIPPGNYGAGAMIVWDRGRCDAHIDHAQGLADGKLLFELHGYKLRGLWTLVRTQKPKEWLLIKKPDAYGTGEDASELGEGSVFSGLSVDQLAQGHSRIDGLRQQLNRLQVPKRPVEPPGLQLMLCESRRRPFNRPGWLFEIKYDGYRLLAARRGLGGASNDRRGARFYYRRGKEVSTTFPDLARALVALPGGSLVLDGEVAVLDDEGRPSFSLLQRRGALRRPLDAEHAAVALPATYFIFDFLAFEDFDLRSLPLLERKQLLRTLVPEKGPLRCVEHISERGVDVFAGVRQLGLEGMVAKKATAPYVGGRSAHWLKIRVERHGDFVVVGFQTPEGGRNGFRGLHLAAWQDGQLFYVGRVGSGFDEAQLSSLRQRLDALRRDHPPAMLGERQPEPKRDVWVEPELVVQVRFRELTPLGHLRHPVFVGLRDDKEAEDCVRDDLPLPEAEMDEPSAGPPGSSPDSSPGSSGAWDEEPREVQLSNLDKVFWPAEGYSKGDLVSYYRAVADYLLPYLEDRPVVLDRYPDGIDGKSFFQKNVPDFAPSWIRTARVWSGETGDETLYFVCDDVETLTYLINLGTIPLHIQSSRLASQQQPDWCSLDLDAKTAPFAHVIEVAQEIHRLCQDIAMPCTVKTSGATGLHVLLPLAGQCTHQQARILGELVARVVAGRLPEISSIARLPAGREGLVYIDFLQNGHGKLLVAPFSARPRQGAPVSMPLHWPEVKPGLEPQDFTIVTAPARLADWSQDPLAPSLGEAPPLVEVLARLAPLVG